MSAAVLATHAKRQTVEKRRKVEFPMGEQAGKLAIRQQRSTVNSPGGKNVGDTKREGGGGKIKSQTAYGVGTITTVGEKVRHGGRITPGRTWSCLSHNTKGKMRLEKGPMVETEEVR